MTSTRHAVGGEWLSDQPHLKLVERHEDVKEVQYVCKYPIPLEHRLYYIEGEELPDFYPLPAELAELIHAEEEWVERTAAELGIEELDVAGYPEYAVPVLKQELEWQQAYNAVGEVISRRKMGQMLSMPDTWVEKTLKELAYEPFRTVPVRGNLTEHQFAKSIVQHLRAVKMSVRPAGTWLNVDEVHEVTGRSGMFIRKFILTNGYEPQVRRARRSGRQGPHYPPELVNAIAEVDPGKKEDRWYTKRDIRAIVGRGSRWIDAHIAPYETYMRMMPDGGNRPREHYPEQIVTMLLGASNRSDKGIEPMHVGDVAITEFAPLAHRNVKTVMDILAYMKEPVITRLNASRQHVPTCRIDLAEAVRDFDTTLLQDGQQLAHKVSIGRRDFRVLQEEIEAINENIKQLRGDGLVDDIAALELKQTELRKEREEVRKILGRSAHRYSTYLAAVERYRKLSKS